MSKKLLLVFCVLVLGLATNALAQMPANQDVGNPALAGSVSYDPVADSWTVIGCGADMWGGWDQFHYVFRPLAGDGSGVVRVVSMDLTHEWAKVGVMIRETLAGDSKHMLVSMTGTHGVQTVWREQTGGASADVTSDIALPIYLKVERIGNTFNTYMTFNPAFWIPQHSVTIDMKPNVSIGMFVCSTNSAELNTTVFDSVDLVAPEFNAAWAVSPADASLADLAGVTISWQPGDTAASHNVYFGTTSPPPLIGNQTETTYDTGALEGGVTYYYQIDEVEADGTTVHAGEERSMYTMRPGTGSITREVWEGIGGVAVSDMTNNAAYPDSPSWSDELPKMDSRDFGDNYGGRLIGMLAPETSGDYTFWILSDDASQLWLSSTGKGCEAEMIAWITGCCGDYDTDEDRQSDPIYLEGGQTYPIWALWKEGGGGDYCRVAWEGPDAPSRTEIDGYFLMPVLVDIAASNPSPGDGATGVGTSPTLCWDPPVCADSYNVYFNGELVASTTETCIDVGPLLLGVACTWSVDAVCGDDVITGCVWSFTVSDNRVIDDFQSYDALPEGIAPQMVVGGDYTIEAVAPPAQEVVGGDYTIAAVAPPEQEFVGGDYTIPGYTEVEAVAPDDTGLAAHYEFENDTTDSSGNGHDGTYDGVPVFVPGAPDGSNPAGAIQFDGQGPQRVEVLPFDVVGSGITIACWFKASNLDTPGSDPRMISKTAGGSSDEHLFMISSSRVGDDKVLRFRLKTDDGTTTELKAGSGGIIPLDVWTHMTATWDGSTMRLYKDGVEVGSTAKVGTAVATNPDLPLSIGNQPSITDPRPWDGLIDDVRIYNYGLSEGEARHLAGVGDLVIDPVYVPPTYGPMRLHLEFEGDANDSSGNGNDGTLMGDAQFEAGPIGQALLLDGDGDYVNVDGYKGINAVDGVQQPFSVANWFRIAPGASDGDVEMVTWGTSAGQQRLTWRVHQGRLRTEHASGNLRGNTYVDDDEWHHGALVVTEGANLRVPNTLLYVDGVQDSTFSGSDSTYNLVPGADVRIGMSGPQNGRYWPGSIDDVRIYDYTLSEGEVRYLAGVGDKYVPPVYGPMRLNLEFEGDLTDSSGNNNDGTAVGAVAFETDPVRGEVLSLPGGDNQYVAVPPVGLSGTDPTTIACWAKADHTSIPDWTLVFGFTGNADGGGGTGSHFNIGSIGGPQGIGAHVWGWEETILSDEASLEWHHYAMTYDGTTIGYYGDGIPMDTDPGKSNVIDLSPRADRVHVGSRVTQASSFPGKVDDARVYDYVLSENEILHVSGIGDRYIPPVRGPLAAHYKLDGDASDSSGNDNHGTLMGDPQWVAGQLSMALQFGGVPDYVEVPHDASLTMDEEVTVAAWINAERHNSAGGDWQAILAKGNSPRSYSLYTYTNGTLHFSTAGVGSNSTGTVPLNEWVHVAAMVVDGRHQYYINGAAAGEGGGGINLPGLADTASFRIGASQEASNHFLGMIDDVRIYDYALTDGQVAGLAGAVPENPISDTWSDWGLVDLTLAAGTMRVDTYGWPGMPYYVGEVSRALPFADLTEGGGKALSTWVQGDPANIAALMYMLVADADGQIADVLYDGDLTDGEWQEWNIDMRDLDGVDVTNATDIAIGVAGLDGGVKGDTVNVDNIRVYTGRCMPDIKQPAADLNDDCVVDVEDLMILADAWGATTPTCTITANGNDIWGNSDNFHYMYKELSGDGEIQARVVSIGGPSGNTWRKAGVMIRETLDGNSKHVASSMTPGNGKSMHWRDATDGGSGHNTTGGYVAPYWVKVVRTGNEFRASMSPDGVDWVQQGDVLTIEMADPIHIGLSLTSHESNQMSTTTFDNVSINGELATDLVGVDVGNPLPGSSECAMILSLADLNEDETVGWMDVFVMLDQWLDEELWPY